jgi:hypothetical protein
MRDGHGHSRARCDSRLRSAEELATPGAGPLHFQTSYAGSIPVARSTSDQRKRWVHDRNLRQHGTNEVSSRSMAGRPGARTKRGTGSIEKLPSGALRVPVYAGLDPLTKRRHELIEIIQPGPHAAREAEVARVRFVNQINERRNPRTNATLDQLLERYLSQFQGSANTLQLYQTHVKNHIRPLLGQVKIGRLDAEVLVSFYAELRAAGSTALASEA